VDNPVPADPDAPYRRPADPTPPTLPSISDYWPDAPHRIGPPADHYTDEPTEAAVDALLRSGTRDGDDTGRRDSPSHLTFPPPPRRSKRSLLPVVALAAVLAAGAGFAGYVLVGRDSPPAAQAPQSDAGAPPPATAPQQTIEPQTIEPQTDPPSSAPAPANVISAPARGRAEAVFELVSDTAVIDLRTGDIGSDLYRITTPQDGSVLPRAQVNGKGVRLFLDEKGKRPDAAVTVLLNADVRWSMRITGGIKAGVFDLGDAKVDAVDLAGDAARIDLTLPRPDGTLPIRLSGGVNRFEVSTDQGVPVRVRARGGAGQVKLDGRTDDGVARGASFLSPHWADSKNRIDLDAVAGVGTLRVGRG
jgi:hypothetical protein